MGWKQFVRHMQAAARQHEREARVSERRSERQVMARHRELARQHREDTRAAAKVQKELARQNDAAEAAEYTNYVAILTSVHVDCSEPWNWQTVATSPSPFEPIRQNTAETAARAALQAHSPNFLDKIFGGAKQQRAQLEDAVQRGIALDQQQYEAAMNEYRSRLQRWNYEIHMAPGVLALNAEACRTALWYVGAFDDRRLR